MGFRSGAWGKIWEITPGDKSTKVRMSTSKKNKQTDQYEQDFSGFVTLAGTAHKEAGNIKVGDRIKIGECDVTSRYDKEKKQSYTNFSIYTFELNEDAKSVAKETAAADTSYESMDAEDEDSLPF